MNPVRNCNYLISLVPIILLQFLPLSCQAQLEVYQCKTATGSVVYTDNKKKCPDTDQSTVIEIEAEDSKWIEPHRRNRPTLTLSSLGELTNQLPITFSHNWLSSNPNCGYHLERIDLDNRNLVQFVSSGERGTNILPILDVRENKLKVKWIGEILYQYDLTNKVLLKTYPSGERRILYFCPKEEVPPLFRQRFDEYQAEREKALALSHSTEPINLNLQYQESRCFDLYEQKEYGPARTPCKIVADSGESPKAELVYARLLSMPFGGDINLKESFRYTTSAVQKGYKDAYGWMAWHYRFGKGVPQDQEKALQWSIASFDAGNNDAAKSIAKMYTEGEGVKPRPNYAVIWYTLAAENGDSHAQNTLGCIYAKGLVIKQDFNKAYYWISQAANKNNPKAIYNLGVMYQLGLGVKKDMESADYYFNKAAQYRIFEPDDIIDKQDLIIYRDYNTGKLN